MRARIESLDDLISEKLRLQAERAAYENDFREIGETIKYKLNTPVRLYNKVVDYIGSFFNSDVKLAGSKEDSDWVTNIFRVGLPVFTNRFLFPKSGFIMKSLLTLLTTKAAQNVNKETITDWFEKAVEWFNTSKPKFKKKEPVMADYGIPPDSETY